MRRRTLALIFLTIFSLTAGALAWVWSDPVLTIRDELRRAVRDTSNHEPYAELVRQELLVRPRLKTATFTMPCFWAAEAHFGGLLGVYRTTPGRQAGMEAVRVEYDPRVTSPDEILAAPVDPGVANRGCRFDPDNTLPGRNDPTFKPDDMDKWSIRQTDGLKCVPMTPAQAAKVNALFHAGRPVEPYLSPAQNALLSKVRKTPRAGWHEYVGDERLWKLLQQSVTTGR